MFVASAGIWWLSGTTVFTPALIRMLADAAVVCVLGLAVTPYLVGEPLRTVLSRRAAVPLTVATATWLAVEVGRLVAMAGQAVGAAASPSLCWLYATATDAGRANLAAILAAALCLLLLWPNGTGVVVSCLAAAGLVTRAWAGHAAATSWGVAAIAVHAVAAGLWCGGLLALAMTVRHRDEWSRVLPAYARMALISVSALLVSALLGALLVIPSWSALLETGYGRVLSAKVVLSVVLVLIGWRQRSRWVPAARTMAAASSHRRAVGEVAVMAVAVVSAAILAMTG